MKRVILNKKYKTPNYKKFVALVDNEDFERVNKYNWNVRIIPNLSYAESRTTGKLIRMHNFIMNTTGIDHINHNGLDNRKSNLRKSNQSQNMMNKRSLIKKYKGIYKKHNKWYSLICINYKVIYLGIFKNDFEAAEAYNKKAKELFGEFANLNKIEKTYQKGK